MKKLALLPLIGLMLTGCSDEITPTPDKDGVIAKKFLTVSLVTPRSATTKAESDYVDGYDYENKVSTIRFFFFDDAGNAADAWHRSATDDYLSYIDWAPNDSEITPGPVQGQTVEKIINCTLGLSFPADGELPTMVLAVLNPTPDVLALNNPSLTQLRELAGDYYTGLQKDNFVITNSAYASSGNLMDATPIDTATIYQPTIEEAAQHPLIMYVERALARMDLSIAIPNPKVILGENSDTTAIIYPIGDKPFTVGGQSKNIYVKFLGWNVTSTPSTSHLVKNINSAWSDNLFGDLEPWNSADYHRSFWAINPQNVNYWYGSYNTPADPDSMNFTPANAYKMPLPGGNPVIAYMQENAAAYNNTANGQGPVNPSKVIFAAQLCDENGDSITLARWANRYYTEEGMLIAAANALNLYNKTTENGQVKFTKVTPQQLKFASAKEVYNGTLPDGVEDYFSYVQLKDEYKTLQWTEGNAENATVLTFDQVNNYIQDRINYLLLWNGGMTYYYFDIQHLGAEGNPGYWGVVRNHIYDSKVKSVAGLGTPVFNPNDIIYPKTTETDDNILQAEIRILQWRIVSQEYNLTWPK